VLLLKTMLCPTHKLRINLQTGPPLIDRELTTEIEALLESASAKNIRGRGAGISNEKATKLIRQKMESKHLS